MSARVVKWSSIHLLHNVVKTLNLLQSRNQQALPKIGYRAKIKLHGTNAAIQSTPEGVFAQSRSTMLSLDVDNKGFCHWVQANSIFFQKLATDIVIFGEWCGPGIEKGMGISKLDRKIFAVFAVQYVHDGQVVLEVEPSRLKELLPEHPDIFILPWHSERIEIDYACDFQPVVDYINTQVEQVEKEDPSKK